MHADASLDDQLDLIASEVVRHQEIQFSSAREVQNYLSKVKKDIRHLIDKNNQTFVKGLGYLSSDNQSMVPEFVANISAKLLRHIGSSKKISKIIETDILGNEQSLLMFADAIESYMDSGDIERELCVLTVMLMLFPLNPQPYLYFGASIERTEGLTVAAAYYAEAVKVFPHPIVCYFGAECFFKLGDKVTAKHLLQTGIEQARQTPELHDEIAARLTRFSDNICC
jgi:hypothetical protein